MCWISKNKPERLVAKEDITVYKVVQIYPDGKILSYFNDFPYKLGEIYNTVITVKHLKDGYNDFYFVEQGFHSYNYHLKIGLDPFLNMPIAYDESSVRYYGSGIFGMLCVIPKGAEYYVNEYGDIVSTSIKSIVLSTKELNDLDVGEHFEYEIH
jgi:hypothetical protein